MSVLPPQALTFQAEPLSPPPTRVDVEPRVLGRELMAPLAVGLVGLTMLAVPNSVVQVLGAGTPAQIRQPIVRRIVILMKAFLSRWAGAYKGLQYQTVNQGSGHFAVVRHSHFDVPARAKRCGPEKLSSIQPFAHPVINATNLAHVADFVVWPSNSTCPGFHTDMLTPRWGPS